MKSKYWMKTTESEVEWLDVSKVIHFVYTDAKKFIDNNSNHEMVNYFKMYGNKLQLTIEGDKLIIYNGDKATELYEFIMKNLESEKELLKG